jgi:phage baseplate assembly protein gpV
MIREIQEQIKKALAKIQFFAVGKITKIDLSNYLVAAEILTTGMKTNWLRIGTAYSGADFGLCWAPNIGDEILICFPTGDPAGQGIVVSRLFGKDAPPVATEDEIVLHHKSGTKIIVRKNGAVIIETQDKIHLLKENAADTCPTAQRLTQRLNQVVQEVNAFVQIFNTHTQVGNLGGPIPPPAAPATPLTQVQKTEIEQANVKIP